MPKLMSEHTLILDPPILPDTAAPERRPRVMQVITHFGLGGAERVAFTLMKGLLSSYDFDLFAVCGMQGGEVGESMLAEAQAMSLRIHLGTNLPVKFGGMLVAGLKLAKAIKKAQPDLIHLHTEIPESAYAAAVALSSRVADVPLVRTIHNSVYWTPWRQLGQWCERRMGRPYIAAVSKPARQAFLDLRRETGDAPLPAPPQVIFNGLAVQRSPARPRDGSPVRLLFAGRFEDQKGADLLPEILRRTRIRQPCKLIIHGSGTHQPLLIALAAKPPDGWSIELLPAVPNLVAQMSAYDLLLMPSRYEGLSLMAIESLLAGLPVVATRAPGLIDGFPADYPWMSAPGDADAYAALLSDVLSHRETWPTVAEVGNRFAREQFDVQAMCDAYHRLYDQAISTSAIR